MRVSYGPGKSEPNCRVIFTPRIDNDDKITAISTSGADGQAFIASTTTHPRQGPRGQTNMVDVRATPVGIAFMIAGAILRVGDIKTTFTSLGMFVVTVTASLGILFFCCVGLFAIVTRRNPFTVLRVSLKAWVISFATTSPIVSIPEMFAGCDDYNMDQSTSRFACPLASALKADGPAAFIACAALFVAQTESTSISPGSIVVICPPVITVVIEVGGHTGHGEMGVRFSSKVDLGDLRIEQNAPHNETCVQKFTGAEGALPNSLPETDRFRSGLSTISSMYGVALVDHISQKRKRAKLDEDLDVDFSTF
ncbi:unnamed protein product [Schistocephalus solidus]|uniref:Amino acid transporter n=1 Tax=Schistocephalus solidus TaxID=70667 RepID=A0A183T145_SCHSO|nr:unnamed protein product [Schistocephalus solidus]